MEIAVLSSSRADFGFYKPLLNLLKDHLSIRAKLVIFGTHLSEKHGYTVNDIKASGYNVYAEVDAVPHGDTAKDIAVIIGEVHIKFAKFWDENNFDLIMCLGDRYEMFAAISASVPFNIPVAHISGGEETFGAIDNIYRHSLTLMSKYHFTNTQKNAERVQQLKGSPENVYYTGSMAIDNINGTELFGTEEFKENFDFDISEPFILFTFHPETVNYKQNEQYAAILKDVLAEVNSNVLVTMPNADTMGDVIRQKLYEAAAENKRIHLKESLGSKGYYTVLKNASLVLGNSSSGIVEAASFGKYVINIGNRQLGRECGNNVFHCNINKDLILAKINEVRQMQPLSNNNIYGDGKAAVKILSKLEEIESSGQL